MTTKLGIADITQSADAAPGADVQFQVDIENVGTCAEGGATISITNLPGGWTGGDVTSSVGYGETVSGNVPVSIPEDAETETVTLTFRLIPGDFIGTIEKQISFKVGEAPLEEEEEEVSPTPVEEETETTEPPKVETHPPAPPVETPGPEEQEQEPVKAPEGEDKGGICGPTVVVLLGDAGVGIQTQENAVLRD